MSFDIPEIHVADGSREAQILEAIMARDHVTTEEAVRSILRTAAMPQKIRSHSVTKPSSEPAPLSDYEIDQLARLGKTFGLLADVSDEQIARVEADINELKLEGLPTRG